MKDRTACSRTLWETMAETTVNFDLKDGMDRPLGAIGFIIHETFESNPNGCWRVDPKFLPDSYTVEARATKKWIASKATIQPIRRFGSLEEALAYMNASFDMARKRAAQISKQADVAAAKRVNRSIRQGKPIMKKPPARRRRPGEEL